MIRSYILVLLFNIALYQGVVAQFDFSEYELPYPSNYYEEIEENIDPVLQANLEKFIRANPYWYQLVREKRMSVGIVDLRTLDDVRYAAVNGHNMVYAASLPKISVLLAAMEAIKEGSIELTPELDRDLRIMISKSNNAATTRIIELLGFDKINETMTNPKYEFYDEDDGGGLWVGKRYAKSGDKSPDPIKGLSHAASVDQVCRYYTMLAYGKLVDEEWSERMMEYMIDPEINHKFVKTLNRIAPNVDIYRKSGSWKNYHADSALVFGENGRKYILVALIEDPKGGQIMTQLVEKVELALGLYDPLPSDNKFPEFHTGS